MSFSRVQPLKLHERLDADFYSREYLANEAAIIRSGLPLKEMGSVCSKCNCGATPKKVVYSEFGTPLIRGAEIRPDGFHGEKVVRTTDIVLNASSSVAAVAGDLVYTMSGHSLGDAAVVFGSNETFSFTNTVVRARFRDSVDPHFAVSFLNCRFGWLNSRRYSTGGDRGHVMPNVFRRLQLPVPPTDAQAYIGDKVRQAEVMRAAARALSARVGVWMCDIVGDVGYHAGSRRWSRVDARQLSDRLDAGYFAPEQLANEAHLLSRGAISLGEVLDSDRSNYGVLPSSDEYVGADGGIGLVRGGDLHRGEICTPTVFAPSSYATKRGLLTVDDVLILAKGACIDGAEGVGLALPEDAGRLFNGSCYRLCVTGADPAYIAAFCVTRALLMQKRRAMANTGTAYNSEDAIQSYLVVLPHEKIQRQIGDTFRRSVANKRLAKALTSAARLLVEALIERKVSEAELVAAHKSAEADRALLERLSADGIDVPDAEPLFPDLDRLEELLGLARQEEAS